MIMMIQYSHTVLLLQHYILHCIPVLLNFVLAATQSVVIISKMLLSETLVELPLPLPPLSHPLSLSLALFLSLVINHTKNNPSTSISIQQTNCFQTNSCIHAVQKTCLSKSVQILKNRSAVGSTARSEERDTNEN